MKHWTDDFIQGIKDQEAGIPHTDKSREYNAGYSYSYECEQILNHKTERQDELIRKAQQAL